ncbi:hypothetical protein HRI_003748100 [Hibiscus trionum]|uniref:Uncharacterized protein n=1 Tax=Hibiscus trionum TaxID=183268 RepID=A0A9W7MGB2_HIBTR|nr:hypothetical protein HRI_003748100 [Hibiscus trionum]
MKRTISFLIYGVWDFTTSCSFDLGIKNVVSRKLFVASILLVSLKLPRPTSWEQKATLSLGFPYAKETLAACCGRTNLAVALSCIAFWLFLHCETREIASEVFMVLNYLTLLYYLQMEYTFPILWWLLMWLILVNCCRISLLQLIQLAS